MAKRAKKKAQPDGDQVAEANSYDFMSSELKKNIAGAELVDPAKMENPEGNSTGSLSLDIDLGIPCPEGKMIEISGSEGSLKTSLAFEILGQALKAGKYAAYVNLENSGDRRGFDNVKSISTAMGVKDHKFRMINADTGEGALKSLRMFVEQFPKSVVVFDSIDACVPEAVSAKDIGEAAVGNLSKLMSDACRKLNTAVKKSGSTIIWINQQREKIGVVYGNPATTSGGRAIKFYCTQRIEMMAVGKAQIVVDSSGEQIGVLARYKIIKNRFAPKVDGEIPILFGHGVYSESEVMEEALKLGLLGFGGRGGKQVLLPRRKPRERDIEGNIVGEIEYFDVDKEDKQTFMAMKRLDAARRLLLDKVLADKLRARVMELVDPLDFGAANEFLEAQEDEILDIEGEGGQHTDTPEPEPSAEPSGQ